MKKRGLILSILLIVSIIILIIAFIDKTNDKSPKYTSNIIFENDTQLLAIAKLETIEEATSRYMNKLKNVKVLKMEGDYIFLIIPRYDEVNINIYENILEEDNESKGNLISKTNLPFVITCDNSKVLFEVEYNDTSFEYIPSISNEDDTININKYILDITK